MAGALQSAVHHLVEPNYYDIVGVQAGVHCMRNRKPVKITGYARVHNLFMTLLSLWMAVETVVQSWRTFGWGKRGWHLWGNVTEPGEFSDSGRRLAFVIWVHYLSKAYEFVDTAIMILKKNNRQITLLHVYHHASTFFPCWWSAVNFAPGGDVWFICALNSSVHVAMYGYYFLSSMGVRVSQGVKKSITVIQLIQFALLLAQALYGVFGAPYYRPRIVVELAIFQAIVFTCLFGSFYRKAYMARKEHSH